MTPELISSFITALTPVVVPLVFSFIKGALPRPAIPMLAVGLGALLDVVNLYVTGYHPGTAWGAVLGAAGVGVREIVDQLKKHVTGSA